MEYILTNDDVMALKQARAVTFHAGGERAPGTTLVRCITEVADHQTATEKGRILTYFPTHKYGNEWVREFLVPSSISDYRAAFTDDVERREYTCFEMVSSAQYSESWKTVVLDLRAGDEFAVKWVAHNDTEELRKAHFATDEVHVRTTRPRKSGPQRRQYLVGSRTTGVDSSARLCRPGALARP